MTNAKMIAAYETLMVDFTHRVNTRKTMRPRGTVSQSKKSKLFCAKEDRKDLLALAVSIRALQAFLVA